MPEDVKFRPRRHHDDDYFDDVYDPRTGRVELRAFMVPRYKTSGLSGDEWRVHAQLNVNAGQVSRGFSSMKGLMANASHFIWTGARGPSRHTRRSTRWATEGYRTVFARRFPIFAMPRSVLDGTRRSRSEDP